MAALALVLLLALPGSALADASITSTGPLTNITITGDLNCAVNHTGDTSGEFYGSTACGTLVASGGVLYGPASIPAGGSASPRTTYTPVSQSAVTGSGTSSDPYTIVTVVDLGTSGLRVSETDSYVVGAESYRTDVRLSNSGSAAQSAIVYRAGDCYLQNSDSGFGDLDTSTGAVDCRSVAEDGSSPGDRIEQWYPLTSGSSAYEDAYSTVWAKIGAQQPFGDTCTCSTLQDNGAGLSWTVTVPAGGAVLLSHLTTFSPLGREPLSTTKTADAATASAGGADGYTITISNPNTTAVTLDSVTDTLPAGFTYSTGSTTGATTSDPAVSGQTLTWSGPISVAAGGTAQIHFGVVVSTVAGDYFNEAGGSAEGFTVAPTGPTAEIVVGAAAAGADLSITKVDSPDPVTAGDDVTYTIQVANAGPETADGISVSDTLPTGTSLVSTSIPCTGTTTLTCNLGSLPMGASGTFTIVVATSGEGTLSNTATVSSTTADPNPENNSATAETTVQSATPPPPPPGHGHEQGHQPPPPPPPPGHDHGTPPPSGHDHGSADTPTDGDQHAVDEHSGSTETQPEATPPAAHDHADGTTEQPAHAHAQAGHDDATGTED